MAAVLHPRQAPGLAHPPQPAPHLRLVTPRRSRRLPAVVYWRRRVVVLLIAPLLVAVIAAGLQAIAGSAAGQPAAPPAATAQPGAPVHVVQPGDTLWGIARSLQPTGDVRPLVDRLSAARGGGSLQVGERIPLPAG